MVNIPSGYAEILATIYGDYMTLPPVEKRVNRHSVNFTFVVLVQFSPGESKSEAGTVNRDV